jgi:uncharacterized membrane protein (DUF2068 family)
MIPKHKRPVGVTLLALLFFFIAFTRTVSDPFFFGFSSDAGVWQKFVARFIHSAGLLKFTSFIFPPLTYLIFGAHAIVGYGLWKLQDWSRKTVFALILFACVIGVLFEPNPVRFGFYAHNTVVAWAISYLWWINPFLWIAWYLNRPRVRFAFGAWPSITGGEPTPEFPPGLSKIGKIWVAAALVASVALFVFISMVE